jgi:hypothetical protein
MTPAEIDACLAQIKDDPAVMAKMETFLNANPGERAQAHASLDAMERDSIELFKREDATQLLLTPKEIEPWLPIVNERLMTILERLPKTDASAPPDPALAREVMEELWPLLGEMAEDIFTPERIQQLKSQIKSYRDKSHAAGDKKIIGQTLGAINQLEREDEPAENYFLTSLCFFSLRSAGQEASARGD